MIFNILLVLHIIAGGVALVSAIGASSVKQCNWSHQWHRRFGQYFFYSMLIIFLTAIPMSFIKSNAFLFFIALFSFYFAHAGWRYARNRTGVATKEDWASVSIMAIACLGMLIYGLLLSHNYSENIVLIVFSGIGLFNAVRDGYSLRQAKLVGKQRLALHASMMLAGLIATVTAFVVTNFSTSPEYLAWIAPSILITPYIVYWNRKLLK